MKPDPNKVDIVIKIPAPQNKTELASFLGMCNYLSQYIPQLSDVIATLRELNKKKTECTWDQTYERAFRKAKLHVTNAVTLMYFDPVKPIVLECDASGTGIGGTLLQDGHPITFVSHALTETQKHYSNVKRELLALVVIMEKLHHFIFGHIFSVHTNHSPLVILFQRCLNNTLPQLQHLLLHLNQYQMDIQYVTQKCLQIANCMSRLTGIKTGKDDPSLNLQIANVTVTSSIDWNQIKKANMIDPTMVRLA